MNSERTVASFSGHRQLGTACGLPYPGRSQQTPRVNTRSSRSFRGTQPADLELHLSLDIPHAEPAEVEDAPDGRTSVGTFAKYRVYRPIVELRVGLKSRELADRSLKL